MIKAHSFNPCNRKVAKANMLARTSGSNPQVPVLVTVSSQDRVTDPLLSWPPCIRTSAFFSFITGKLEGVVKSTSSANELYSRK